LQEKKGELSDEKLKKLLALGAAAMMLVGSASLPVSAISANTTSTGWSFNVEPTKLSTTTSLRTKVDASYSYVYYKGGTKDYFTCDILNSAGVSQCKKTGPIKKGERGLIEQYVYEHNYRSCKLKLTSPEGSYGGGTGYWSPDSNVTYRVINK